MRTQHTAHSFDAFPVNSAAFLSDRSLVLGGGGGASKTGVKNRLVRPPLLPVPTHRLTARGAETVQRRE
jgi:hypothetical protein